MILVYKVGQILKTDNKQNLLQFYATVSAMKIRLSTYMADVTDTCQRPDFLEKA